MVRILPPKKESTEESIDRLFDEAESLLPEIPVVRKKMSKMDGGGIVADVQEVSTGSGAKVTVIRVVKE